MLPVKPVAANVACCPAVSNALLGLTVRNSCEVSVVFVHPATDIASKMNEQMKRKYFRSNVKASGIFSALPSAPLRLGIRQIFKTRNQDL
jgi:hypothetical protein